MTNDFTQSITHLSVGASAANNFDVLREPHRINAIQNMTRALNHLNEYQPVLYANVYHVLFAQCHKVFHPLLRHFGGNPFSSLENIIQNRQLHESSSVRLFAEYSEMENVNNYVFQSQERSVSCERTVTEILSNSDAGENTKSIADEIINDLDSFLDDFSDWYNFQADDHDMGVRAADVFPGSPER